jgi:hypothetical protein
MFRALGKAQRFPNERRRLDGCLSNAETVGILMGTAALVVIAAEGWRTFHLWLANYYFRSATGPPGPCNALLQLRIVWLNATWVLSLNVADFKSLQTGLLPFAFGRTQDRGNGENLCRPHPETKAKLRPTN